MGEKKDYSDQIANLKDILFGQRGMLQSTSTASGLPTTTLHRNLKAGNLSFHNNAVKPLLTEENKPRRMVFSTSFVALRRDIYLNMVDVIHVDEKWLKMTKNARRFYLALGEGGGLAEQRRASASLKMLCFWLW